ncbi:MAG TPA: PaaI family thioesterase [Burkholderiales bacterium]|nr:PaaI family thioesterase [Burkholderiales bacterium]
MALAVNEKELELILAETEFIQVYGFKLVEIGAGECTLKVPFQKAFLRPGEIIAGPIMIAAADVAMWFAIMTDRGPGDQSVTLDLKTAFLNSAGQEDFLCKARVLKFGKRLVYGVAECVSLDDKPLTHHTLTYILPGN